MSTLLPPDRVPAVATKLSLGAKTTGNGFTLKWTVLPTELSTAPRFVGIGSSTFAGNGASVYANSVAGKLATQLNVVSPGTGVLCNNALALQDTRNGLPNGADALVRENRNISMALAANLSSTQTTRAQLKLSGLLTTNVYNIGFVSSRDTTTIDRIVCLTVNDGTGVDKRDGLACTTAPNVPNQTNIRTLEGIVPAADGTITIDIHCAGPLSYLNGMVIRRMSNA